ncbi:unnamed protein product [Gordionus sp. m RMFG-2023]|uniref:uncharacterized protein LOC135927938 n=1 Tax=Gordionus sp. m RMFG-2023 TaxID=3053472 RepID=UPI0030E0A8AA
MLFVLIFYIRFIVICIFVQTITAILDQVYTPDNCNITLTSVEGNLKRIQILVDTSNNAHLSFVCLILLEAEPDQIIHLFFKDVEFRRAGKSCDYEFLSIKDYKRTRHNDGTTNNYHMNTTRIGGNEEGKFCSFINGGKMYYYSEYDTVKITLKRDLFDIDKTAASSSYFKFQFIYRFVSNSRAQVRHGSYEFPKFRGKHIPYTYCDKLFVGCEPSQNCRVQSPGWPGTYLRNITCKYYILGNRDPSKSSHLLISGGNGIKSKIILPRPDLYYTNSSIIQSLERRRFTNCRSDRLEIYDGLTPIMSNLIVVLCGNIKFPDIITRTTDILIVFKSAFEEKFGYTGFELIVQTIKYNPAIGSLLPVPSINDCYFVIDASKTESGKFSSLRHWVKPRMACILKFEGVKDKHRVLLLFNIFIMKLDIYKTLDGNSTTLSSSNSNFCDRKVILYMQNIPFNLTRDSAFNSDKAILICPGEIPDNHVTRNNVDSIENSAILFSYLSEKQDSYIYYSDSHGDFDGMNINFVGSFIFVDVSDPIGSRRKQGTVCEFIIDQQNTHHGKHNVSLFNVPLISPRNELLYGLGFNNDLRCRYVLRANPGYQVALILKSFKFDKNGSSTQCTSYFNRTSMTYQCLLQNPSRYFKIFSEEGRELGCFCDNVEYRDIGLRLFRRLPVFNLIFVINNIEYWEGKSSIGFLLEYSFLKSTFCPPFTFFAQKTNGNRGQFHFPLNQTNNYNNSSYNSTHYDTTGNNDFTEFNQFQTNTLSCHWIIVVNDPKYYVYLKLIRLDLLEDCGKESLLIYSLGSPFPFKRICHDNNRKTLLDLFSLGWYSWSSHQSSNFISKHKLVDNNETARKAPQIIVEKNSIVVEMIIDRTNILNAKNEYSYKILANWILIKKPQPIKVWNEKYYEKIYKKPQSKTNKDSSDDSSCGFKCPGACIDKDFVCDGFADCPGYLNISNSPEERTCANRVYNKML